MPALLEPDRSESSSSHGTSRSLIERVRGEGVHADQRGDAWNQLVALYAPMVMHWCRTRKLGHADTADVFQETFQAVALHIGDFRKRRKLDTFRGWLRTITLNKINDHFRKLQREPRGIGGSEARQQLAELAAPTEGSEASAAASASSAKPVDPLLALGGGGEAALPPEEQELEHSLFRRGLELIREEFEVRTWQAFWMTAVDGRATADVAADLKMTPGAVRVAKSRVLNRLRAELGDLQE